MKIGPRCEAQIHKARGEAQVHEEEVQVHEEEVHGPFPLKP